MANGKLKTYRLHTYENITFPKDDWNTVKPKELDIHNSLIGKIDR